MSTLEKYPAGPTTRTHPPGDPDGLDAYDGDFSRFAVPDDQLVADILQRRDRMRPAAVPSSPQPDATLHPPASARARPRQYPPTDDPEAQGPWVQHQAEHCAYVGSTGNVCGRCIAICPGEALDGRDGAVRVDPAACMGCGVCSSVCPTGAMRSLASLPQDLLTVVQGRLADARLAAPGAAPAVVFSQDAHQGVVQDKIDDVAADPGQGPRGVAAVPITVAQIGAIGPEVWLGALAYGAGQVVVVLPERYPKRLYQALAEQCGWITTMLAGIGLPADRIQLQAADAVAAPTAASVDLPAAPADFAPFQSKRALIRRSMAHLVNGGEPVDTVVRLPAGAPFGRISVAASACTLCMACVAACPTGALEAAGDRHAVRMRATACIQCGRCRTVCPEQAIVLWPEMALEPAAHQHRHLLCDQAPFACLSCGRDFAPAGLIAAVIQRLEGHWAAGGEKEIRRLKMCPDCRVRDLLGDPASKDCP
jgi:ferredoxin